ncbi:MAG: alkaline phosphatase family protein [Acidimicrobiia bacterium]
MRIGRGTAALAAGVVVALVVGGCSSGSGKKASRPASTTRAARSTTTKSGGSTATSGVTGSKRITHVAVINLENKSYANTFGPSSPAPYLSKTLPAQGQLLTQYFGVAHVSLPNYLAEISGQGPSPQTQGDCITYSDFTSTGTGDLGQALGTGCVYPSSVKTIADQLTAKGLTWKGYMEDMANSATEPKTCRHPALGSPDPTVVARKGDQYATRHNPFVYFHSIVDSPDCAKYDVDLNALDADLASESTTPNLLFITPNLCHDGHDEPCVDGQPGGLASADTFLKQWVPKIMGSAAFKDHGMLVVTFDEAEVVKADKDASVCCNQPAAPNVKQAGVFGDGGGRIGAVILSPAVKAGTTNDTPYNHYALLCSLEDLFGLDHLGFAAQPGLKCFGSDVYNAGKA